MRSDDPGQPEGTVAPGDDAVPGSPGLRRVRVPLWAALLAMIVALVVSLMILVRVARPLYALLFPLQVPVPEGVEEIAHEKPDNWAESWVYRTQQTGLEIAAFYRDAGGECSYVQDLLENEAAATPGQSYQVARCTGSSENAAESISWEVLISAGYSEDEGPTVFRIYRYEGIVP